MSKPLTPQKYIDSFDKDTQAILNKISGIIKKSAPLATEKISYGMIGYYLKKPLIYFGAFKNHIGLYPTPSATTAFDLQLKPYKHGKGSIQFPLKDPIPYDLITKIIDYRIKENKKFK